MRTKCHTLGEEQRRDLTRIIRKVVRRDEKVLFSFLYGSFPEGAFFRDIDLGVFAKGVGPTDFWDYEFGALVQLNRC